MQFCNNTPPIIINMRMQKLTTNYNQYIRNRQTEKEIVCGRMQKAVVDDHDARAHVSDRTGNEYVAIDGQQDHE